MTHRPAATDYAERLDGVRVLVIEDEFYIADDLRHAIAKAGAEVVGPIGTAAQANAAIDKEAFDCVVLDLNLKGESGIPIADRLIGMKVPFVIATGYGSPAVPDRLDEIARIEKPFEPSALVPVLVELMRRDAPSPA